MHCVRNVTKDLFYVGVDDNRLRLFENIHPIPRGVSYNSYLLVDENTVLFDTVDWTACRQFMENIAHVLGGRKLDYLVIHHMEPDHGACIEQIIQKYPDVKILSTEKAFLFMKQFGFQIGDRGMVMKEGDTMSFGMHEFQFVMAPMVHWPEVMTSFCKKSGILFTADAFGSFGALNGALFNDEVNFERDWLLDSRRYYCNIVGKYGPHVQALLRKVSGLAIKYICPLHGPVWRNNFGYFLDKYNRWSSYTPEQKGVLIPYASMYGNTEQAAIALASKLITKGCLDVKVCDVSTTHISELMAYAFQYSHMALFSVTYNLGIYPHMLTFLEDMRSLNMQHRTIAVIENGTWACNTGRLMTKILDEMKQITILEDTMTISSSVNLANEIDIEIIAQALIDSMASANI